MKTYLAFAFILDSIGDKTELRRTQLAALSPVHIIYNKGIIGTFSNTLVVVNELVWALGTGLVWRHAKNKI